MKKFSAILICLLMIITCSLAGCATFSIDKVKYYNEVLATVDETKITRYDLLNAYNSYGSSYYVQQMGQSESEAMTSTLDLLVDRELMYQYALDNDELYRPTPYQVNSVVQELFDSMDEQMDTYIETAKSILDIETEEIVEEEKENETAYLLKDYTYSPRAEVKSKVVNGEVEYYIDYILPPEDSVYEKLINEDYLNDFTAKGVYSEIKNKYFNHLKTQLEIDEKENATAIYNKIRTLFAKNLIDYEFYLRDENGKKYSTNNEDLFDRYFKRTFENNIKFKYLENIRTYYLEHPGENDLSIELLTKEYEYMVTHQYNLYDKNHTSYKNKMKDIGTNGDSVLYHPTTDAQFGYFVHTLISFDSIKENLTLLKEEKNTEKYEEKYNNLIRSITVKARNAETGLVDEDAEDITLSEIFEEYNNIKNLSNNDEKLSAFINFMFKYTSDTATLKSGMPYVVGTNGYSAMVEEFNDEAILLMTGKDSEGNSILTPKEGNMSSASMTDIENLCITEYGIHLLYYIGDVNKFDIPYSETSNVYIQKDDIDGSEMYNLATTVINPLTNKKYFDMMFDLVYPASSGEVYTSNNGYTDHEKELVEISKKTHKVTKNDSKIAATKTSL